MGRPAGGDRRRASLACSARRTSLTSTTRTTTCCAGSSPTGQIRARRVTGLCPQHQRESRLAIKRAREMALLPYVVGR